MFISWACNIGFITTANSDGLVWTAWKSVVKSWWHLPGNLVDEQGTGAEQPRYRKSVLLILTQPLHSADHKTSAFTIPTG